MNLVVKLNYHILTFWMLGIPVHPIDTYNKPKEYDLYDEWHFWF